jgi:hypothetical protein
MTTSVALLATTVSMSEPLATILVALALMVTIGAADVVVCEPDVVCEPEDEPVPLPHAERTNNENAGSTMHRVQYL